MTCRNETDLWFAQAQRIIDRIGNVLVQLPDAIDQTHERLIGERVPLAPLQGRLIKGILENCDFGNESH